MLSVLVAFHLVPESLLNYRWLPYPIPAHPKSSKTCIWKLQKPFNNLRDKITHSSMVDNRQIFPNIFYDYQPSKNV